jgi:hypothetical protein
MTNGEEPHSKLTSEEPGKPPVGQNPDVRDKTMSRKMALWRDRETLLSRGNPSNAVIECIRDVNVPCQVQRDAERIV